ncbi:MAG TPA: glycosyl transferase [Cryomorphaceae bacterium]|nr:glycosyl transferase [Cryomorphaceae bacterium]
MKYFDRNTWLWIVLSALFFLPFLGGVHLFDWDEINFAELAREMVVSGDFIRMHINYEVFTEKPPLFFWMQALSMKAVGVGEYAARLPNAILGIILLPFLYISGKFLVDRKFGWFWALSWMGSMLPFLYFKSGIIDPWFNFFTFNGIFFLIHYIWKKKNYRELYFSKSARAYLWIAGISAGLAILAKGPVAFLVIFLCLLVYWFIERFHWYIPFTIVVYFSLIALGVPFIWFGVDMIFNGPEFVLEFTLRQWELLTTNDAGHGGFPGYHFVVLLLGCFPASIFAIRGLGSFSGIPHHIKDFQRWMIIMLVVVLVLFSIVGTKIIHYSSLAYYPLTFLSALALYHIYEQRGNYRTWMGAGVLLIGGIIAFLSWALPYAGQHPEIIMPLLEKDPFARENMEAKVNWDHSTYIPLVIILITLIAFFSTVSRQKFLGFSVLFFGMTLWVFSALIFFIGRVERISQRAAVEFFQGQQGKEVYVTTFNYKSYVPWFYARVQPYENPRAAEQQWLLNGETDRPVYISCKVTAREKLEAQIQDAEFLYAKNGFLFYRRN